jgi:Mn-containing catalase
VHRKLYTFSATDYKDVAMIWKGNHPGDGGKLEVIQGTPSGGPMPDLENVPEEFAPGISHEDFMEIAKRLQRSAGI